jgi:hypothetical protein
LRSARGISALVVVIKNKQPRKTKTVLTRP